jgi:hypothetical protein
MDFSGFGINKAFKSGQEPDKPYYYINASLDLAGRAEGTYYFNADNNFEYALNRDYNKYIIIDENMIISEITVFANNDLIDVDGENPDFWIGGAPNPSTGIQVSVPWAAPTGSSPGLGSVMSVSEINSGSVHLFGHEGGNNPYSSSENYKYLAITINPVVVAPLESRSSKGVKRSKKQLYRGLPSGDPVILEGKVSVSIKVYPKIQ